MKHILKILLLLVATICRAQEKLPVTSLQTSSAEKPVIFFISGDGGMNDFTTDLISDLNKKGYAVHALNARNYFWKKKSPVQAAIAIAAFLDKEYTQDKPRHFLFIGFSFGADVLPFILGKMPAAIQSSTIGLVLIAPSASTDFEIHLTEMLGFNATHGLKVAEELNKLSIPKMMAIVDESSVDFQPDHVHQSAFKLIKLTGGHHFEGNENLLSSLINENF